MKNPDKPQNNPQNDRDFQNPDKAPKSKAPKDADTEQNPYDSEHLDNERDSRSKDLTEKDIEKDLLEHDPSEGFETDVDANDKDAFQTIDPDKDNPVNKEFEIGRLSQEDLKEDESIRDETVDNSVHFNKPSERKF